MIKKYFEIDARAGSDPKKVVDWCLENIKGNFALGMAEWRVARISGPDRIPESPLIVRIEDENEANCFRHEWAAQQERL